MGGNGERLKENEWGMKYKYKEKGYRGYIFGGGG